MLLPRALTCLFPHTSTHMETSKTHTNMATDTSHTRRQTHCTHTMHTNKWEHAASFRSICFQAGAVSCVGRVCVRMLEFFQFIPHRLHDTPGFITILLFPWQVLPLLSNSRVITTKINTKLLQIKNIIRKIRSYLLTFRSFRKHGTFFYQTPKLKQ